MVIDHLYDEKLINQTDALYNLCLHGCLFHLFRNTAILSEGVNDTSYKPCMLWLSALFPPSYLILFSFLPSSLMYNLFNNTDFFNTVILLSKFYCPPVSSWKKNLAFYQGLVLSVDIAFVYWVLVSKFSSSLSCWAENCCGKAWAPRGGHPHLPWCTGIIRSPYTLLNT